MKLSNKLRALEVRLGVSSELAGAPLNTPSDPLVIPKINQLKFVSDLIETGIGFPTFHCCLPDSLYLCFVVDLNTKVELKILTPESESLWNQLKKSLINEFANRFSRVQ